MSLGSLAGLTLIVRRSLRQHALSTSVTVVATALAAGLVMSVFSVSQQTRDAFTGGRVGFDAVLGARGSQLQLVLNTVFHLETSPGNIPWSMYRDIAANPAVKLSIPYAVGDNYRGYRIVGTTGEMFTDFEYQEGQGFTFARGRAFDPERREAVIGSIVAERTELDYGSKFNPYHGLSYRASEKHPQEYVVVGVLEPTNSPSDRVVWIPIEGVFRMEGHVLRGTGGEEYRPQANVEIPDEHKEVSAVMLKFHNPRLGMRLSREINQQGKVATLAWPIGQQMAQIFEKLGWVNGILEIVAYLVVVVAAASILASIYNTMNERRREFAVLRSLGARRRTVFGAIVLEAATIAALGSLLGYVFYAGVLAVATTIIRDRTGVVLELFSKHPALWITPLGMIALGALSGLLPAFKAYRTDVATNLQAG